MMKALGLARQRASQFALLFSVVPAYNIYSAVSLDGVIVSISALFILGMVTLIRDRMNLTGILLFVSGLLLTDLLTFSGIFLIATAGLVALREMIFSKNRNIMLILLISLFVMLLTHFYMLHSYGYNHIQAFLTASNTEPLSLNSALAYVMTRLENIAMLLIFLSFGILAVLLRPEFLKLRIFDLRDGINSVFFAGLIPLLLFLLMGGLYTGEIARIFLFICPFFFLLLRNVDETTIRFMIAAAGIQTCIMQTFGGYFW
ncbi:MAG: hypothetical protein HY761_08600 [Candidatus Omnitrophica bacterium]|nr:hypothetical protein [Candidatus Omnitrophota bacterium]